MQVKEIERGKYPRPRVDYIPIPCQHCQNAPCIDAAKDGAVYRRDDGIVMIDPEKAKGQDQIVGLLPVSRHLLERRPPAPAEVRHVRPSPGRLATRAAALRRVLPDRGRWCSATSTIRRQRSPSASSRRSKPEDVPSRVRARARWCRYVRLPGPHGGRRDRARGLRRLRRRRESHARGRRRLPGDADGDLRRLRLREAAAGARPSQ